MTMSNIIRSRKEHGSIPQNSEEVARSQPRIDKFLSDSANKDNTRPCALSSPDAEETSNRSPQVKKVLLLKGIVLRSWGYSKNGMVGCETEYHPLLPPLEFQNPNNFLEIACKSKVNRGGGGSNKAITAPKLSLHNLEVLAYQPTQM